MCSPYNIFETIEYSVGQIQQPIRRNGEDMFLASERHSQLGVQADRSNTAKAQNQLTFPM